MKRQLVHTYQDIISQENLLAAWQEFLKGKRRKHDVQLFGFNLLENIVQLHDDLTNKTYRHGGYHDFYITDPKLRHIHKASVRDRLVHRAIYRVLCPFFDRIFSVDSYSCRINKGVHKAINRFRTFGWQVSKNNTKTCWVLKCDIRKFFDSIDHRVLMSILNSYIPDKDILWLLKIVIDSFSSGRLGVGLPLGNLTSQLFVNVYMNVFDQFVKHKLKSVHYVRYADDFVLLSDNRGSLERQLVLNREFLDRRLRLALHPNKISIRTLASGVDYLGWVQFSNHRVLRTKTKQRMFRKIMDANFSNNGLQSYLGLFSHGNTWKLRQQLLDSFWIRYHRC
ncbi:MAG: reverse transcriptase/maturase family protein [bacterium]